MQLIYLSLEFNEVEETEKSLFFLSPLLLLSFSVRGEEEKRERKREGERERGINQKKYFLNDSITSRGEEESGSFLASFSFLPLLLSSFFFLPLFSLFFSLFLSSFFFFSLFPLEFGQLESHVKLILPLSLSFVNLIFSSFLFLPFMKKKIPKERRKRFQKREENDDERDHEKMRIEMLLLDERRPVFSICVCNTLSRCTIIENTFLSFSPLQISSSSFFSPSSSFLSPSSSLPFHPHPFFFHHHFPNDSSTDHFNLYQKVTFI